MQMLMMLLFSSECITGKDVKLWRAVTHSALAGTRWSQKDALDFDTEWSCKMFCTVMLGSKC